MLSLFRITDVSAHCDLPCGVYDPAQARIEAESIKAIIAELDKKLSDLRKAAEQFAIDAPHASTHTNFAQAVISIRASVEELEGLLAEGLRQTTTVKVPPSIKKPGT